MAMKSKQMTPFESWISLFPQAPLFGVEWQFAKLFPMVQWFNPADVATKVARASMDEAVKATETAADAAVTLQEHVTASVVTAMPMPAEEVAVAEDEAPEDAASVAASAEEDLGTPPATLYDIAPAERDDLKRLKGVGPKLETMLNEMGIYRFDQIATFTPDNLAWVDANLTAFKGRPTRDDWVSQAKALL
jgi:predicted flap endonuclease-1-like 5' DNA nuclease